MIDKESFEPRSEEELDRYSALEWYYPEKFAEIQLDFLNHLRDLNACVLGEDIHDKSVAGLNSAERLHIDLIALGVEPGATAGKLQVTNGKPSSLIYETPDGVQVSQLLNLDSS